VILLSWMKDKSLLRVSGGSLRAIRRAQTEKALAEQAELAKARKLPVSGLYSKPQ